jgi:hypothetical protein
MGERDKSEGREFGLNPIDRVAAERERERKLRMLQRLSEVLGRPIEDFFKANADSGAIESKVDDPEE